MSEKNICGSTNTHDGKPCQRAAGWGRDADGGCCVDHTDTEDGTGRRCLLKRNESIVELVAGELQTGATVPEACAEAGISTSAYHEWRRKGEAKDADDVFVEFLEQTARARSIDAKEKRRELWQEAMDNGDYRTAYKLYHDQHGDTFGEEGGDGDAAESIPLVVPENARPET
jgi:hypothetical protein